MKKPQYGPLLLSKEFRTRAEAEEWAKSKKNDYKRQGESVKIDVNFVDRTSQWRVQLFLKI